MEPICGIKERGSRDHAVDAGNSNAVRRAQPICGAVVYLAWLKHRFNGDLRLITAAYYVGESRISLRGLEYSSPDVQGYVKRVAQRYRMRRALRAWNELAEQKQTMR